jgi:hypothetical protein
MGCVIQAHYVYVRRLTFPATLYNPTHMKNFALPGNPNETLTRDSAIRYLVDQAINNEELEWTACSIWWNPKEQGMKDLVECAELACVKVDSKMLQEVYDTVKANGI